MTEKLSIKELLRVIDLCLTVERRGIDPFEVDVVRSLKKLRAYLPRWELPEELLLDAEALRTLSSIIKLQGDWVKYRSSSLYIDPLRLELKIKLVEKEKLAECFLGSYHPIASGEQLTVERMMEAMDYWEQLSPMEERFGEEEPPEIGERKRTTREELTELGVLTREEFQEHLDKLWGEIQEEERVLYRDFIYRGSFEESAKRAYVTSFLVSMGHARLEVEPLEEEVHLVALGKPLPGEKPKEPKSVATRVSYEEWMAQRGAEHG